MSLIAIDFIDNPGAGVTRQMKRQTVGGPKEVGIIFPFDVELVGLALSSDDAVTAGQASCQPRGAATVLPDYPALAWTSGVQASHNYAFGSRKRIMAGTAIDIEVTTDGTYAPATQDLICTAIFRVLP